MIPTAKLIGERAHIVNLVYSDDYLQALNKFASVDEVLAGYRDQLQHWREPLVKLVEGIVSVGEPELYLATLIQQAAEYGEWRAIEKTNLHSQILDEVVKRHCGHVTNFLGKNFLMPSASYVAYCKDLLESL